MARELEISEWCYGGSGEQREREGSAVGTADFLPTPGPARPLGAAERHKERPVGGRPAVERLAFGHGMPCPYESTSEVSARRKRG